MLQALVGGVLVGCAAAGMLAFNGRILGVSGIMGGLFHPTGRSWRLSFVFGLLSGGVVLGLFYPQALGGISLRSPGVLVLAGLLVGYGTRLGSGCTSGHGVCGVGRLSLRSVLATITFIVVAMITVGIL